jgi:hypothetical protein
LLRRGAIVWGAVAQANEVLFSRGRWDAPANIIWSRDTIFEGRPEDLVEVTSAIFDLKNTAPEDAELADMARTITDELNAVVNFEVPSKLTGGRRVAMTTTLINRGCLPGGLLAGRFFPLLIDAESPETNCVLPAPFWPADLVTSWERTAAAVPVDEAEEARKKEVSEEYRAEAQKSGERGELYRLTPAAIAELRRVAGKGPCVLEVRCVYTGTGVSRALDMVGPETPCFVSYPYDGVRIHLYDELTALLGQGVEIDYVRDGPRQGFALKDPPLPSED